MKRFLSCFLCLGFVFTQLTCTNFKDEGAGLGGVTAQVNSLDFSSSSSERSFAVTSGEKWSVLRIPDWLKISQISGRGFSWSVTLLVEENSGYNRSGTLTLNSASSAADIFVSQEGKKGAYVPVESVSLSQQELVITEGETKQLTATVSPTNASVKNVSWKSSSTSVATVSSSGLVTAVSEGTTTITVTTEDGNKTATCKVTVKKKVISVTGVSLDKTSILLMKGETSQLIATISPSNATNKNVSWRSSSTSIATVSSSGLITAVGGGTATITVTTEDGTKTATCQVEVRVHVTGVSLDKTELSLTEGDAWWLTATVNPADAWNMNLSWKSSSTSVATVSSSGLVTAISTGSATITVTTEDGGYSASCSVTVTKSTTGYDNGHAWVDLGLPSGLKWATCNVGASSPSDYGSYFAWGETSTKSNYDWSTYKWCSGSSNTLTKYNTMTDDGTVDNRTSLELSDDAARTNWGGNWRMPTRHEYQELLDNCTWAWTTQSGKNGYKVFSKTNGNSLFLPAAGYRYGGSLYSDGTKGNYWSSSLNTDDPYNDCGLGFNSSNRNVMICDRSCGLSVRPVYGNPVRVISISLNKTQLSLNVGESEQLTATVLPSNAGEKGVNWSSNNPSVASVNSQGLVTAQQAGTATITVTTIDGSKTASCQVTVKKKVIPVTGVSLDKISIALTEGETSQLTATVSPSNATNKNVSWKSSSTSVATVSSSGLVTAVSEGNATITVTTEDGSKTATCKITTTVDNRKEQLLKSIREVENALSSVNSAGLSKNDSIFLITTFADFAKARQAYFTYSRGSTDLNLFYYALGRSGSGKVLVDSIAFTDLTYDLMRKNHYYGYSPNTCNQYSYNSAFVNIAYQLFGPKVAEMLNVAGKINASNFQLYLQSSYSSPAFYYLYEPVYLDGQITTFYVRATGEKYIAPK